jgi:hypothetical protein
MPAQRGSQRPGSQLQKVLANQAAKRGMALPERADPDLQGLLTQQQMQQPMQQMQQEQMQQPMQQMQKEQMQQMLMQRGQQELMQKELMQKEPMMGVGTGNFPAQPQGQSSTGIPTEFAKRDDSSKPGAYFETAMPAVMPQQPYVSSGSDLQPQAQAQPSRANLESVGKAAAAAAALQGKNPGGPLGADLVTNPNSANAQVSQDKESARQAGTNTGNQTAAMAGQPAGLIAGQMPARRI